MADVLNIFNSILLFGADKKGNIENVLAKPFNSRHQEKT